MNARDVVLFIAKHYPGASVPIELAADAVREASLPSWRPAPGCPWRVAQLAQEFGMSGGSVTERIVGGDFDVPGGPQPYKNGKGLRSPWVVPDACVQRFRERRNGLVPAAPAPAVDLPTPVPARRRAGGGSPLDRLAAERTELRLS